MTERWKKVYVVLANAAAWVAFTAWTHGFDGADAVLSRCDSFTCGTNHSQALL